MPGFFSSETANHLTKQSSHLIDWSRVGELLASGRHIYTRQQLAQRGMVLGGMAVGAYVGYTYAQNNNSSFISSLCGMAGCFVGFVLSHMIVIAPLIYKRAQMRQSCLNIEARINQLLTEFGQIDPDNEQLGSFSERVMRYKKMVMELDISDETGAKASQTWGRRKALMSNLLETLLSDVAKHQLASTSTLLSASALN